MFPAVFGPAASKWFGFLQKKVQLGPGRANAEIAARVGLDQCVFAPAHLLVFLTTMSVMEGRDPRAKLDAAYMSTLRANWLLWPWVQALNFKLVPLQHRLMVVNVVALGGVFFYSFFSFFFSFGKASHPPPSPPNFLPAHFLYQPSLLFHLSRPFSLFFIF